MPNATGYAVTDTVTLAADCGLCTPQSFPEWLFTFRASVACPNACTPTCP